MRTRSKSGERNPGDIVLTLTRDDQNLLLECLRGYDSLAHARVQFAPATDGAIHLSLPEPLLAQILARLIQLYEDTSNRKMQRRIGLLLDSIEKCLPDIPEFDEPRAPQSVHFEIQEAFKKLLSEGKIKTMEDASAVLAKLSMEHNQRPREEFVGLSPEQMRQLVQADWISSNSPLKLRHDLHLEALSGSSMLRNTRTLLRLLVEQDGTKATAAGNLNRKFVQEAMHLMLGEERLSSRYFTYLKVVNEYDVSDLFHLRHLAQFSGLIRRYKGKFVVTRKGSNLYQEGQTGELYTLLFKTFFTEFNLSCLDGCEPFPEVQGTIDYTFHALSRLANDWADAKELTTRIFAPHIASEMAEASRGYVPQTGIVAQRRIYEPMESFGLLEFKLEKHEKKIFSEIKSVRKTPLFDKFIQFQFSVNQ